MGLPKNTKHLFQERYSEAFVERKRRLEEVRESPGVCGGELLRVQTLVVADANVLLKEAQPSHGVLSLQHYVTFLADHAQRMLALAAHVVFVWDEAKHTTKAKAVEQHRRDRLAQNRAPIVSEDMAPVPRDDDYLLADLEIMGDSAHLLLERGFARQTRERFFDAISVAVLQELHRRFDRGGGSNSDALWSVGFDGVDARGADRPVGAAREPTVVASHAYLDAVFAHANRAMPIGEGDLKLTHVCDAFARAAASGTIPEVQHVCLHLLRTNDTDSFAIELVAEAERRVRAADADAAQTHLPHQLQPRTMLCLKENGARQRKGTDQECDEFVAAKRARGQGVHAIVGTDFNYGTFNVVDVAKLYEAVLDQIFGTDARRRGEVTARDERAALFLYGPTLGMGGCDFYHVPGLKDHPQRCIAGIEGAMAHAGRRKKMLAAATQFLESRTAPDLESAVDAFALILQSAARAIETEESTRRPALAAAARAILESNPLTQRRMAWTAAYWARMEIKNVAEWGFSPPCSEDMNVHA